MKLADLLGQLDPAAHIRGRQFERICKWYLQNDPVYAAQLEEVWLWDEWPDRDGPDAGIDLVAKTKSGDLWAIQAKAYDPERNLAKSHVDSFLANSARSEFTFRLILTTSADLSGNLWKQLAKIEPRVSARVLSDLHAAKLDWPESPSALRAQRPEPKEPREHQREAIRDVVAGFKSTDRGQLIMACGTGKTLVGLWVAERLKAERTLVLLPSLSLLSQVMEEWLLNGKGQPRVLAVCSDESVTRGADEWVSSTAELGYPVTTDPEVIAAAFEQPGPILVFSTYHSSPQIAEAQRLTEASFDLAVADEAHRCTGRVSSDFATILDSDEIRAEKRLFMTATPRYFSGRVKKLAGQEELEIASMDDEAQFGPVLHRLTFGEAIERDLLSPYQVVVIGVDDPTYKRYAERGRLVTRDGKEITDARYLATQIALAKAMRDYDLRRTITFHGRVSRAREFAEDFPEVVEWMPEDDRPKGDLWCDHVEGKMPTSQRRARLDRLRGMGDGGRGLLANAKCLGEGVDVPTLDGVAFIDPRRSQVDIVQNVGRAIRKAENKNVGTIVLPVFIASDEDPESVISGSAFKPIFDVLRALRDHDEELAERLDAIRYKREWGGTGPTPIWPSKLILDLPGGLAERFSDAFYTRVLDRVAERPPLTIEQVLEWADSHYQGTGRWPSAQAGPVRDAPGENWRSIQNALRLGLRGLDGGSSLAWLLAEHRDKRHPADLPPLTIVELLAWADAHHARSGEWPKRSSGPISEAPNEVWKLVDNALVKGYRGLPSGLSLAKVLAEHRDVRNTGELPDLMIEQILIWADDHHAATGEWPTRTAGAVLGSAGEKWSAVNTALINGLRGLPDGRSLAQLLAERRNVRNIGDLPNLNEQTILSWADDYHRRHGEWPSQYSGTIYGTSGETWFNVSQSLRLGLRGLPTGSSLAKLLDKHRGVRNLQDLQKLSEATILNWADAHHDRTGAWPNAKSSSSIPEAPDETWQRVNDALIAGRRGLPGGSSLPKVLARERAVRHHMAAPKLTVSSILSWADSHRRRTGDWPKARSGPISEAPDETWAKVNGALHSGARGLPGGSSLARLLAEHRGVVNIHAQPDLTAEQILAWADSHRERTGDWPRVQSGRIAEAPHETWSQINQALDRGGRGLPVGSSLARLLAEHRGTRNKGDLPPLSVDRILLWADGYRDTNGKWPSRKSGSIDDTGGETWNRVDDALKSGYRGFPGGSSLAKLLDEHRRKKA